MRFSDLFRKFEDACIKSVPTVKKALHDAKIATKAGLVAYAAEKQLNQLERIQQMSNEELTKYFNEQNAIAARAAELLKKRGHADAATNVELVASVTQEMYGTQSEN